MKLARIVAGLFGILGTGLMVFSIGLCFVSLDAQPQIRELPAGAEECTQAVMEAFQAGDLNTLSGLLYGQPDLGENRKPENADAQMVWDAYRNSVSYEFLGDCYVSGEYICRDVSVTYLDVSSVTQGLSQRAHALLTARVEAAEDMAELYDEHNEFREDLMTDVMQDALVRCLAEDGVLVTQEVTLTLVHQGDSWRAVPEEGLFAALSGGLQ